MFGSISANAIGGVTALSADILGVLGVTVLLVAWGLAQGKDALLAFLLSLYPAALLTAHFPYYSAVAPGAAATTLVLVHLVFFLVTLMTIFLIVRNYIESSYQQSGFWRLIEVLVLSLGIVGLIGVVLYHSIGIETYFNFSIIFDTLFASSTAFFIWLLAPLVSIPLFVRP